MAGLEVEHREPAGPPLSSVVVARIEGVAPHPNADRLRVCTVDAGDGAPLTIVCGAPNAAPGMKVPLARVGATLPGEVAIRDAEVRGVRSQGMLCSAKELGLDDDASGLLVLLDDALVPGTDVTRGARARRHAAHAEADAEPRRLPVDARHRARSRGDRPARR